MRPHCQRQRVIEKLNGAHIVIPGQGETTLALRAYYPIDFKHQHQQQQQEKATSNPNPTVPRRQVLQHIHQQNQHQHQQKQQKQPQQHGLGNGDNDADNLNGLRLFQRSFAMTIVFFVLPKDSPERQHQEDDPGSFMHRAMSLLIDHQPTSSSSSNTSGCSSHNNNHNNGKKKSSSIRMTRVFVVQDTAQAIETIMVLADTLSPEKRLLKQAFFKRQRVANFMPVANLTNTGHQQEHQQQQQLQQQQLDTVATCHAAGAFREWATNFQLPPGEADVVMDFFRSNLQDILTATEGHLAAIPIEDRTRKLMQMFFESSPSFSSSSVEGHGTHTGGGGGAPATFAAAQDHDPGYYYHPPPQNHHRHQTAPTTFTASTAAPSCVGHEAVWNGIASTMYGGGGSASYNNPSCQPGHVLQGTNNNMNGNCMPYTDDAAMYPSNPQYSMPSNPQYSMPMTGTQNMGSHQLSLLATGGPYSAPPTMTPAYLQLQQQQQHHQPPMTQGRAYNGGGGGGATMTESSSSMYHGNNGSRFAGGGGGGGGVPLLSQREQMRRWM